MKRAFLSLALAVLLASPVLSKPWEYPESPRGEAVDSYHGVEVDDPYRWLEEPDSPATTRWVEAQNRLTFGWLRQGPTFERLKARLTTIWNYARYSLPGREAGRLFYFKNDGLQNQSVLYVLEGPQAEPRMVLDPNALSADGTASTSIHDVSPDGKLLAYGISYSGSDRQVVRVREVDTGKELPETLEWCKFTSVAWTRDNLGFYYNRYPEPGTVSKEDENNYNRVYHHRLNTPQSADELVYERPDAKELGFAPATTDDGRYLFLTVWHGTDPKNRLYYKDLTLKDGPIVKLLDKADAMYSLIDNVDTIIYLHTDLDAPRGRVVALDLTRPDRWRTVVPESQDVIDTVAMVDNRLFVAKMRDARHVVQIYDLEGKSLGELPLPGLGTVTGMSGKRTDRDLYLQFASYLIPPTVYRFQAGKLEVFRQPRVDFDFSPYATRQLFATSKDGTRVPMFVTCRKDLTLDGSHPTILYGYGGFNISLTPTFSASRLAWLEAGGILAVANLRGGNEYGETWHQAGMLGNKQNVFDDFIACAEHLIAQGYTRRDRLAINGGSNGGLLVAACETQRPDLFGAVVCQVPVIDMLRYHKFTVGRFWVPEYGSSDDPEQFRFLYAYSPLHRVKPGTAYPPTLITTADTDDRVVPAHAKKFAAALQAVQRGSAPVLVRVETRAGHGGGKPTSKVIEEAADIYTFLFKTFGMEGQ
ncbi:MAG: prolyl oligopeptidase family serine peptidase [Candidatus Eremiobacterota bacterium]